MLKGKVKEFLKAIKSRKYEVKDRFYVEAQYLALANFCIGKHIEYEVDNVNRRFIVTLTDKVTRNSVAQITQGRTGKIVPCIDLKGEDVKEFFRTYSNFNITIYEGKIIVYVKEEVKAEDKENGKVIELENRVQGYSIGINTLAKAVNCEQTTIFDLFKATSGDKKGSSGKNFFNVLKKKAISVISLFSGCGMLDKGFKDVGGYEFVLGIDRYEGRALKDYHIQTYRKNIGDHIRMDDVLNLTEEDIPGCDFVVGGIPCVEFSGLNTTNNFRDSDKVTHPLLEKFIQVVKWSGAKGFLIENVPKFLTVKGGILFKRLKDALNGFKIVAKRIIGTQVGSVQKRDRVYIFGLLDNEPTLDVPTVVKVKTVKEAFDNIENAPQQDLYFKPTPKVLEMFKYIGQGGNILDVPEHLRPPKKKFTNFCQRLAENMQAPTITHVQDDRFFHPTLDRYLSVRETARLFSLPDDFTFIGSLTAIFEMLKNGVDYAVSTFLAKTIKEQLLPIL